MASSGELTLYHLTRANQDPLFVHPLGRSRESFKLLDASHVQGYYGQEPRVESLTMFRNQMYRKIEEDVREWMAERRFMPRFLTGAGVFLATYLLLTLVVRDPIPMVDELILALVASFATYVLMGRRDLRSEEASKRRIALRNKIDAAVFSSNSFVAELEGALQRYENTPAEELAEKFQTVRAEPIWAEHGGEATRFLGTLEAYMDTKKVRALEKQLQRKKRSDGLLEFARKSGIDLPLSLIYLELKQELASV